MQPQHTPAHESIRLIPSVAIVIAALAVSLIFANAYEQAPRSADTEMSHSHAAPQATHQSEHHPSHPADNEPGLYAGGLWNPKLGLAAQAEALLDQASPRHPLAVLSVTGDAQGNVYTIYRSPIRFIPSVASEQPDMVFSIDHAGGAVTTEFENAVTEAFGKTRPAYRSVLVISPLPAIDAPLPDGNAHDWTYLWLDENIAIYSPWVSDTALTTRVETTNLFNSEFPLEGDQPERRKPNRVDEYLAVLHNQAIGQASAASGKPVGALIDQLGSDDPGQSADARWALRNADPYEVIPLLHRWLKSAGPQARERRLYEALQIHRLLRVHADALIAEAAASTNTTLRVLAARTIGELAEQTTNPLGKLTPLAEDEAMRVRYEALAACRAIPGRRSAGVAQLVEPYEMTSAMRAVYAGTMQQLLAYGEPIPADSRANRLRRMPINTLLAEKRDALVCTILLERTDLPDDKITAILTDLSTANGNGPLTALLNLLESMNPATLIKRDALLTTLVNWKTNELAAQLPRLVELAQMQSKPKLSSAAVAAMIRSTPNHLAVIESVGLKPVVFEGLAWLKQSEIAKDWIDFVVEAALTAEPDWTASRIAALDAIKNLPESAMNPDTVKALLGIARGEDNVDLRFAAIRAIDDLPASIKPTDIPDLQLTRLTLETRAGMKYDKTTLQAIAGRPVELTLINPDSMEHNVAITRPGQMQAVGMAISSLSPSEAAAIGYIPEGDAVLYHTPMLKQGMTATLRFVAPAQPGQYPYVCTYPGHYPTMNGVLEVVAPK